MEMSGRRKSMQHRSYIKILLFFLVFLCTQNFNNIKVNAAENTIQLLELEQPGKDYVYLSWSAAENVNGYIVYRSEDNGKMFERLYDLEKGPGEFSYPAIVSQQNEIYVTYTYDRKNIAFCHIKL